ncbi:hypothetical protein FB45DRAFT_742676 [Roridomyces roridus]|uniref:Carrier domain-containing protein n=1 Tax=Roridomyces roridus TaxID=1738132 RepID=A0AAD7FQ76_9AGAR|nr:hypothetical protein FB45DRAFT_742676 [Roridomyces roridus]
MEACAVIQLPKDHSRGNYYIHPIWIDAVSHISGFLANKQAASHELMLCIGSGTMEFLPELIDPDAEYLVYAKNILMPDKVIIGEVYAMQLAEPRRVVAHVQGLHFHPLNLSGFRKRTALMRAGIVAAHDQLEAPTPLVPTAMPVYEQRTRQSHSADSVARTVMKIICDACDLSADVVNRDTELDSMGIDSMMSIELVGILRLTFPDVSLDSNFLYGFTTVGELCEGLVEKLDEA